MCFTPAAMRALSNSAALRLRLGVLAALSSIVTACGSRASSPSPFERADAGVDGADASSFDRSAGEAAISAQCQCDPSTQYCLHGDLTTTGATNVVQCEPRIGDCFDCGCYTQIGLCLELALPEGCVTINGLIIVECAQIP